MRSRACLCVGVGVFEIAGSLARDYARARVALLTHRAKRMRRITLPSVDSISQHYLIKGKIFEKKSF
jgi:hypothetical protein